jgi:hypothetical protein
MGYSRKKGVLEIRVAGWSSLRGGAVIGRETQHDDKTSGILLIKIIECF